MNVPFQVTAVYVATPIIKKLLDYTDNQLLAAIAAAGSSADIAGVYDIVRPTASFWLTGFSVIGDGACKCELGVVNAAGSTFIPLYPTVATKAAGGGVTRRFESSGPLFTHNASTWFAAIRVTGDAAGTFVITGDVGCQPRAA